MAGWRRIYPEFWDGSTGLAIRSMGFGERVTAVYLLTAPGSHQSGLYKLPLSTAAEHLGLMLDPIAGISRVREYLRSLEALGFAFYDALKQQVFVPNMARFQIGEKLRAGDKQIPGIRSHLAKFLDSPFLERFLDAHEDGFHLQELRRTLDMRTSDTLRGIPGNSSKGISGPSCTETETEIETDTETGPSQDLSQDPVTQSPVVSFPSLPVEATAKAATRAAALRPGKAKPWDALTYVMSLDDPGNEGLIGGYSTEFARDAVYWHWIKSDNPYWQSRQADVSSPERLAKALPQLRKQMPDPEFQYPEDAFELEMIPDPECERCAGAGSTCRDDPDPFYPLSMMKQVQSMCSCRKPGRFRWEFAERTEKRAA